MGISRHFNFDYTAGIPQGVRDRLYMQDLGNIHAYLMDAAGYVAADLTGASKFIMDGGICAVVSGPIISISALIGYAPFNVTVPAAAGYGSPPALTLPPTTTTEDISLVRIFMATQASVSLSGFTGIVSDGATKNYLKIKYADMLGSQRQKAKVASAWSWNKTDNHLYTCNNTPPTAYELCLTALTWAGGGASAVFYPTDTNVTRRVGKINGGTISISAAYTVLDNDGVENIFITTGSSHLGITLPAASNNPNRKIRVTKIDTGTGAFHFIRAGSDTIAGAVTYPGLTTETPYGCGAIYRTFTIVSDGISKWNIEGKKYERQYIIGNTYNGIAIAVTISGASGYSLVQGVLVPYQNDDGSWRMRINHVFGANTSAILNPVVSIAGVVYKNIANNYQALTANDTASAAFFARANLNTGDYTINLAGATPSLLAVSGDVELESKPTWVQ